MTIQAIETTYKGHRFRSRLEARWAVFFDHMGIPWQYESQGYVIDGRAYLPDFHLPQCGTWIEVKGSEDKLDKDFLISAGNALPEQRDPRPDSPFKYEVGPRLMILGPIPAPAPCGDYGWISIEDGRVSRHGFGTYMKNHRPWWLCCGDEDLKNWLKPSYDPNEWDDAQQAYAAARSARFEHGQSGA